MNTSVSSPQEGTPVPHLTAASSQLVGLDAAQIVLPEMGVYPIGEGLASFADFLFGPGARTPESAGAT